MDATQKFQGACNSPGKIGRNKHPTPDTQIITPSEAVAFKSHPHFRLLSISCPQTMLISVLFPVAYIVSVLAAVIQVAAPPDASRRVFWNESAIPLIDSQKLQNLISDKALKKGAEAIYSASLKSLRDSREPNRAVGLLGHEETIKYIQNELRSLGDYYNVTVQPFDAIKGHVNSHLLLIDGQEVLLAMPFALTPPTPGCKPLQGKLVSCGLGCEASDFSRVTKGDIVLVTEGECEHVDKLLLAVGVGAVAMIAFDPETTDTKTQFYFDGIDPGYLPSIQVPGLQGKQYQEKVLRGETVRVSLCIDSYVYKATTHNVIAETKGGDHNNVLMLGAHSDTVLCSPGVNDDGSGIISLLEVAKQLRNFRVKNAVRFAWFSAEEQGLVGSTYYSSHLLPEENLKIRVFMDYDMVASPNFEYQVYDSNNENYPPGLGDLRDMYIDFYRSNGLNYSLVPIDGRSDYVGFLAAGIPLGGVMTGADKKKEDSGVEKFGGTSGELFDACYHQPCDNLRNLDYLAWLVNTRLIAHVVATFAKSWESFPKREKPVIDKTIGE